IQSFNATAQTAVVRCAIMESIKINNIGVNSLPANLPPREWQVQIPLLVDVPVVMPRAGGFEITLPVTAGDECLVIFADLCIDAWWQNGGVQARMDKRRHDFSDGFAILGPWSQPRVLTNYQTNAI